MKRFTAIALLCLYSLTLIGLGVKQFYCCGKLMEVSVSLANTHEHHCKMDEQKRGCCETAFKTLKVEDSHFSANKVGVPDTFFFILAGVLIHHYSIEPITDQPYHQYYAHGPPLFNKVPKYVLHCIYRV